MKDYRILFPNEPYNRKCVDSAYLEEFIACRTMGIKYHFYDYEELTETGKLVTDMSYGESFTLIYRGWMLKPEQYAILYNKILQLSNGYITLLNSPKQYETLHCFPNVYEDIKEFTPRIILLNEWESSVDIFAIKPKIDFDFFLKDHVKSVKTDKGVEKIEGDISVIGLYGKVHQFVKERGDLFTGGIVLKEFVDLMVTDGKTNEWRAFFLYGNLVDISNNSDSLDTSGPPVEFVNNVNKRLCTKSNFYTIDFALTDKRRWIVIETGDGGVSGLTPQCNAFGFYNKLDRI